MIVNALFVALIGVLALIDAKKRVVPNLIVLPAIAMGVYLTKNWQAMGIMFLIGMALFGFSWKCPHCGFIERHWTPFSFWRGGDVKLMALLGAFLGFKAALVLLFTLFLILIYRWRRNTREALPVTPFAFIAMLPFIFSQP